MTVPSSRSIEVPDGETVKIFDRPMINLRLFGSAAENNSSDRFLSHHVGRQQGSLGAMNFEAGRSMADSERVMKLRQNIPFETDDAHDGVFHSALAKSLTQRLGNNLFRSHAKSEMQRISIMQRDIERYAGAGGRIVQTPSLQSSRKIHGMKNSRGQRLTDHSFLDESPQSSMGRGTAQMMIRTERQASLSGSTHHFPRISQIQGQRFLAKDWFARPNRRQCLLSVFFVGATDVNNVEIRIGKECLEILMRLSNRVFLCVRFGVVRDSAYDRMHHAIGLCINSWNHPGCSDVAGTNQTPTQFLLFSAHFSGRNRSGVVSAGFGLLRPTTANLPDPQYPLRRMMLVRLNAVPE